MLRILTITALAVPFALLIAFGLISAWAIDRKAAHYAR
jgi:hypothetical protein